MPYFFYISYLQIQTKYFLWGATAPCTKNQFILQIHLCSMSPCSSNQVPLISSNAGSQWGEHHCIGIAVKH